MLNSARESKALRDVLLITLGFPPARGGIQSWMRERARHLAGRVVVLAPAIREAATLDSGEPYPIYRWPAFLGNVPGVKRVCQFIFPSWIATRLLRQYPITMIECGQALPFGLAAWILWKACGVPYRVWVYGDDILKPAAVGWTRTPLRLILSAAASVLAVSEFSRRQVMSLGIPAGRTRVIYPTPATLYFETNGEKQAERPTGPILLTVARLERRKGIDVVLRMLPALRERFPGVRYRIAGGGPARPELERLAARLNISGQVDFLGNLSDEDVREEYRACDLFVLLSTPDERQGEAEGFGVVYLEAAACGRPAVGWRTGGVEEAVLEGRTGLLVERDDETAALEAVTRLLSDAGERQRLGEDGRAWAGQMADRTRAALQSLDGPRGEDDASGH